MILYFFYSSVLTKTWQSSIREIFFTGRKHPKSIVIFRLFICFCFFVSVMGANKLLATWIKFFLLDKQSFELFCEIDILIIRRWNSARPIGRNGVINRRWKLPANSCPYQGFPRVGECTRIRCMSHPVTYQPERFCSSSSSSVHSSRRILRTVSRLFRMVPDGRNRNNSSPAVRWQHSVTPYTVRE